MAMQQIDPSVYDALLSSGLQSSNIDPQIAYQQQMAKQLRAMGQAPQVRMSGRRAVAPGALEMLGALANQGVASSRDQQGMDLIQKQNAIRNDQVQQVLRALQSQRGGGAMDPYANPDVLQGPVNNPQAGGV